MRNKLPIDWTAVVRSARPTPKVRRVTGGPVAPTGGDNITANLGERAKSKPRR